MKLTQNKQLTSDSFEEKRVGVPPEFAGHAQIRELFGLSRSYLYRLAGEGKIQSVSLRERGKLRGRRLFVVDSVRSHLCSHIGKEVAND